MGAAVGIDLGTTNTVVGFVKDGWPITLADEANRRLLPSIVSFHPSGKVLVGHSAKERRIVDASNTISSVKRLLGRPWESPEVQRARKTMSYELMEGVGHEVQVVARGERYTVPEISAFILRRAKAVAEAALGVAVGQAVIAVPANFNDLQREATKLAGKLAGLEVLRILSEPTAAALAYGESAGKKERVVVYDLGGGTFDVTLLDVSGSVFQVLATGGDTALGGDDIDDLVANLMVDSLLRQHRYDARSDPTARATLKARAEELKILLSGNSIGDVSLDKIVRGEGGAFLPASFRLDRRVLETLAAPIVERTLETSRRTLEKVGLGLQEIDRILLVGGSTRMPLVGRRVEEYFERKVSARVNPDEVVAHGAAIQAAALARGEMGAVPSIRPAPSFSSAPDLARADREEPRLTPRVGEVVVPLPPRIPSGVESSRGGSPTPPPAALGTAPARPRTGNPLNQPLLDPASLRPSAPPARPRTGNPSERISAAPISQDQEALLRAFLGAEKTPVPEERTSVPPLSVRPPKETAVESELLAFLSDAPPPVVLEQLEEIEELEELEPLPPSEEMIAVPDLPPLEHVAAARPMSIPTLASASSPPPIISERPRTTPSDSRPAPAPSAPPPMATASDAPRPAVKNPLLIDVTPLSLGVETVGGFCDIIIRANSPVPCDRNRSFRTASDGQTAVTVRVCQGESDRFEENATLGDLRLTGFRSAPRGEIEITVTFEIDADGILNVEAAEVQSGRKAIARIELLGAQMDPKRMEAMIDRQARHEVA